MVTKMHNHLNAAALMDVDTYIMKDQNVKNTTALPGVSGGQVAGGKEVSERKMMSSQQAGRTKTVSTERKGF